MFTVSSQASLSAKCPSALQRLALFAKPPLHRFTASICFLVEPFSFISALYLHQDLLHKTTSTYLAEMKDRVFSESVRQVFSFCLKMTNNRDCNTIAT